MSDLKIQGEVTLSTEKVDAAFDRVGDKSAQMAKRVEVEADKAGKAVDGIGTGATKTVEQFTRAESRMVESIRRSTQELKLLGKTASEKIEFKIDSKGLDAAKFAPYIEQLKQAEAAQRSATGSLNNMGVSAAQTAAAMRLVPAQFTDIVTSLQGGQKPITVLLQQGGQLKDMFGGVGNATKALATYVVSLVNPFTVAAAAAGVLGVAYFQGSKEADGYRKSLVLTGNAAGTTANQLADMAKSVSLSVGTQGKAAEVLALLASSGNISSANFSKFAEIAIRSEKLVGTSVEETVKQFSELGKAPVEASLKLNDTYHYLNASIYEQIKALENKGKIQEAGDLAEKAYADASDKRLKEIAANLGTLEKGWNSVTEAVKKAWGEIKGVGRPDTAKDQFSAISSQINEARQRIQNLKGLGFGDDNVNVSREQARLDPLLKTQAILQENLRLERQMGIAQADNVKQNDAKIKYLTEQDKYQSRELQFQKESAALRELGKNAGQPDEKINSLVADLKRTKFSDLFNVGLAELEAQQKLEKKILEGSLANVESQHKQRLIDESAYIESKRDIKLKELAGEETLVKKQVEIASGKRDLSERTKYLGSLKEIQQERKNIISAAENEIREIILSKNRELVGQAEKWRSVTIADKSALDDELALFGKSAEARKIAIDQIKIETELRGFLSEVEKKGMALSIRQLEQLYAEAEARKTNIAAIMGQRQALEGAEELRKENLKFAANQIVDERDRAAALLDIDANVWRERIKLAGEGTEAQKKIQKEFDQWYANQQLKPVIDRWKSVITQLDSNFKDGFSNMLSGGKDAWKSFTQSISNTLKKSLADTLYDTFVKKYVVKIVAGFAGSISSPGVANALTGQAGSGDSNGVGGATSLLQAGESLWSGFSSGFSSIGVGIGNTATQFGNAIGSPTLASYGPAIGSSVTIAAAAAASIALGRALSGGLNTFSKTATDISSLLFGGGATGLFNRAFGLGDKQTDSFGIRGNFTQTGFTGENFLNFHQDGGWFRSDKRGTDITPLSTDLMKQFSDGYQSIIASSNGFAAALGLNADSIKTRSQEITIDLTQDATKNQEIITQLFSNIGNQIARELIPNISEFSKAGENAGATLQRLAETYAGVDSILTTLNKTSQEAFGAVGLSSANARNRLVELAGGLDALKSGTAFFAQNFLTEAEQIAPIIKNVTAQLSALGLAGDLTKEQFKNVVLGLDLGSESGAKMYAEMIKLAPAFAQAADYAKKLEDANIQAAQESAKAAQQAAEETAKAMQQAADESRKAYEDMIQSARKSAQQAVDSARSKAIESVNSGYSALQRSVQAERDAINKSHAAAMDAINSRIKNITDSVSNLTRLSQTLRSTAEKINPASQFASNRADAQAQIQAALTLAKTGGIFPDADKLSNALSIVSQPSEQMFSTFIDYQRDLLRTKNSITELANLSDVKKSAEDDTLTALNDQLKTTQAGFDAENLRLDGILSSAQSQIDALNGINQSVLTVTDAVKALNASLKIASSPASTSAIVDNLYSNITGVKPDQTTASYYTNQVTSGQSTITDVAAMINNLKPIADAVLNEYATVEGRTASQVDAPGFAYWVASAQKVGIEQMRKDFEKSVRSVRGFAGGGNHSGGWRMVGEQGPELEYTAPSYIVSNQKSKSLLDTSALEDKVQKLNALVEKLCSYASETSKQTRKTADTLLRVTRDGESMLTEAA